jgi:hypothetical protein
MYVIFCHFHYCLFYILGERERVIVANEREWWVDATERQRQRER